MIEILLDDVARRIQTHCQHGGKQQMNVMKALCTSLLLVLLVTPASAQLVLEPIITTGLLQPLGVVVPPDGTGRHFIVLQGGEIVIWDGVELLTVPFLDLTDVVTCCGGRGLLGLAFHPTNGRFYVNFTELAPIPDPDCPRPGGCTNQTAIVEYQVSSVDPNVAEPNSMRRILSIPQLNLGHNAGDLNFGPDGYLYIAMGDGDASSNDPWAVSQPLDQLLGKVVRLDVDALGPGDCGQDSNYGIPADNPFLTVEGACDEIWASGLRNPWRFSFDRDTGDMFIADVGAEFAEEVDFQSVASVGGENYGWPCMESLYPRPPGVCLPPPGQTELDLTLPILGYRHDSIPPGFTAIIGGYRYRGSQMLDYRGAYIWGDIGSGLIFIGRESEENEGEWSTTQITSLFPGGSLRSFGEDDDGELLAVLEPEGLFRLWQDGIIFADSFESGDSTQWEECEGCGDVGEGAVP